MNSGAFISFEGSEGAGKSTMIETVYDFIYNNVTSKVIKIREPGGTPIAEQIRSILKTKTDETLCSQSELLLMYAARAQLVESLIKPKLQEGFVVIADRYDLSTLAYQGGGRGISDDIIYSVRQAAIGNFHPDLTILMDIDVTKGMERVHKRGKLDRFEHEQLDFFERVRQRYLLEAKKLDYVKVVDASNQLLTVTYDVLNIIKDFLNARAKSTSFRQL